MKNCHTSFLELQSLICTSVDKRQGNIGDMQVKRRCLVLVLGSTVRHTGAGFLVLKRHCCQHCDTPEQGPLQRKMQWLSKGDALEQGSWHKRKHTLVDGVMYLSRVFGKEENALFAA